MSRPEPQVPLDAWTSFVTAQAGGGVLDGRVVSVLPFGAFVEVADGIRGLLPRTAWTTEPRPGAHIPVKVDVLDVQRRRMSLVPA